MGLCTPIAAFFLTAMLAPWLAGKRRVLPREFLALVPAACFGFYLRHAPAAWDGTVLRQSLPWAPQRGLSIDLWLTPVSLLLALLVSGIGTLIVIYAASYLRDSDRVGRFFGYLFLFAGAMLGLATSENLLMLFLFWELTSISSYLLIGHFHEKAAARTAALQALLITGAGGAALLAGVILIGEVGGSYRLGELMASKELIQAHALYPALFACFFMAAATKSAQVPLHFWLPGAMAAPAPVSAYLHSATMVKAGVFLLTILHPLLGGTPLWHYTLMSVGALTMAWGALVAMVQTDLKRLLAFSTVSALGTLIMLLGMEHTLAIKAALLFFIVHALYKGALFMVAGCIEKATGTRDINQLHGLLRMFPMLGIGAVTAAFSMSGLPPFVGFIAKELLYEVKLEAPPIGFILLVLGFVANAATVVVALKVGIRPFIGSIDASLLKNLKPRQIGFWIGPVTLGIASLILGIFPGPLLTVPLEAMVSQAAGTEVNLKLKLWHGFNLVLLLSACTVATGIVLYLLRKPLSRLTDSLRQRFGWSGAATFDIGLKGLLRQAGRLTRWIQTGDLSSYLAVIFFSAILLLSAAWLKSGYAIVMPSSSPFRLEVLIVALVMMACAVMLLKSKERMTSILLLGCIGFSIAALYGMYGAPDLAITQIIVESLTLLLFALAIYGLPQISKEPLGLASRVGPALVAGMVGAGFTLLTLKAFDVQLTEAVSHELAARSLPEAYGRNVVNVILVDFRALDTLGEITVLFIAALGVFAMLGSESASFLPDRKGRSSVLDASARVTAPLMIAFSLYLLLRGHNEPGGGFIGGLVAAMAAILLHLGGVCSRLCLFRLHAQGLMLVGLAVALASGLPSLLQGRPYLTAWWGPGYSLPLVGNVKLGGPFIFDVGVYLAVAGVVLMMYQCLASWHTLRRRQCSEVEA